MRRCSTRKAIAIGELKVKVFPHTYIQLLVVVKVPNRRVFVKKVVLTTIQ